MKLVKIDSKKECKLWEFFKNRLPSSLRATEFFDGYGEVYGIEVKKRTDILGYFSLSTSIATVGNDYVELRRPEWFDNFEDLIREFEHQTGKSIEFRHWES